jgi:release factor glutamine methyltransferase
MTFGDFEKFLRETLGTRITEGEKKAIYHMVIEYFTGIPRTGQRKMIAENLPEDICTQLKESAEKLRYGMPVQYVLGEAWFLNRKFAVGPAVLIPRPETEELVLWLVEKVKECNWEAPFIIDIGTGSGCIAVSVAIMLSESKVTAIDISKEALLMAVENAKRLEANLTFKQLNFLDEQQRATLGTFDMIVSNPPYIPTSESVMMESHVTAWEPSVALFTPNHHPQIFYEQIIDFSREHLSPDGFIFLEGHQDYLPETEKLFTNAGFETEIKKDIHGNLRMLMARFKS